MDEERWIIIPKWDGPNGFQHYRDRDPKWIKVYTRLMADEAYLGLTGHQRAVLHGIWLEYASGQCQLRASTVSLSRRLNLRVTSHILTSLSDAGFILLSASKPLAKRYGDASLEESKRHIEKKGSSSTNSKSSPTQEARPAGAYADELARLAATNGSGSSNGSRPTADEPYFARLLTTVGDTEDNFAKLRRASRGKPTAAFVVALEAATNPTTRDPLAVALTVLADYGAET